MCRLVFNLIENVQLVGQLNDTKVRRRSSKNASDKIIDVEEQKQENPFKLKNK
jgi:hypothetical protein